MRNNNKNGMLILVIIAIIYTVAVFVIPFQKGPVFWLSYLFTLLAIICQGYALYKAFNKEGIKSKFYGFPIVRVGFYYLIIQFGVGLSFMAISNIAPIWLALVIQGIMWSIAIIGFIASDAVFEEVSRQGIEQDRNVSCIHVLQSKIIAIIGETKDTETLVELNNLAEDLRFSDPVSNISLQKIEADLMSYMDELQKAVRGDNNEYILSLCRKARKVLIERNELCKKNKSLSM